MRKSSLPQSGFTLIELLIVIVIIGILAGVLVAIIDPAQQQSRARDATVQATLNKIALAAGGFRSAYGTPPTAQQILGSIEGETAASGCTAATVYCEFTMAAVPLPAACNTTCGSSLPGGNAQFCGNSAAGSTLPCRFRYQPNVPSPGEFSIWAKSYGINDSVFRYDSSNAGQIRVCTDTNPSC